MLAVLVAMGAACRHEDTDDEVARFVIEDHGVGAWVAINNQFAQPAASNRWNGILLQVGDFPTPGVVSFKSVTFEKAGAAVGPAVQRTDFTGDKRFWVNIVARGRDADHVDPMQPQHVLALLPGPSSPEDPCPEVAGINAECLRSRKIHAEMENVIGVVTYWQGAGGYRLEARQESAARDSRYEFGLLDEVKVEIYTIHDQEVTPVGTFDYGEVDLITVTGVVPPEDGNKQDPPWPPPPPGT